MNPGQTSLSPQELISVQQAFEHEGASVRAAMRYLLEDKEAIAASLLLALSLLKGQTLDRVLIEGLHKIEPAKFNQGLIDFQLQCSIDGSPVNVGVAVLQGRDPVEVCTHLNRLLSYKDFGLNRLCILRSADWINDTPQIQSYLPRLLSPEIGGSFVDLQPSAIGRLLTILYVFRGRHKYSIDVPHILEYLQRESLLTRSGILRDLMVAVQI
jgi:hypothetical protein